MKAKKLLAAGLIAGLITMSFAGCSSQNEAPTAENNYGLDELVMVRIPGEDSENSRRIP